LPYLPDRQGWVMVESSMGEWRPRVDLTAVSRNFRDQYNTELNSPRARVTLNLGLARTWDGRWMTRWLGPAGQLTTELELMNATNNRVFDLEGFPLPGRSIHAAISLKK
jgi:hypothetical protein